MPSQGSAEGAISAESEAPPHLHAGSQASGAQAPIATAEAAAGTRAQSDGGDAFGHGQESIVGHVGGNQSADFGVDGAFGEGPRMPGGFVGGELGLGTGGTADGAASARDDQQQILAGLTDPGEWHHLGGDWHASAHDGSAPEGGALAGAKAPKKRRRYDFFQARRRSQHAIAPT
jgi:hypothetical protein